MIIIYRDFDTRFLDAAKHLKSQGIDYKFRNAKCFTGAESDATGIYSESSKIINHYATFNVPLLEIPDAD